MSTIRFANLFVVVLPDFKDDVEDSSDDEPEPGADDNLLGTDDPDVSSRRVRGSGRVDDGGR